MQKKEPDLKKQVITRLSAGFRETQILSGCITDVNLQEGQKDTSGNLVSAEFVSGKWHRKV